MSEELLNLIDERFEISDGWLMEYRGNDRVLVVPVGVTAISRNVFEYAFEMEAIYLPRSIRSISCPFDQYNINFKYRLREVHVPDIETWLRIDFDDAYSNFLSLRHECDSESEYIQPELFIGEAPLVELVVPAGVNRVKQYAFSNCRTLRTLVVNNGVEEIGKGAFCNCDNLETVILPEKNCRLAPYLSLFDGIFWGCGKLTTVELPEDLIEIPEDAFAGCRSLRSIKLPKTLISIGRNALQCDALERLELPDSLEKIGTDAFVFATWGVSAADYEKLFNVYDNAHYLGNARNPYMVLVKAKNKEITACTVAAGTKFIMSNAFRDCTELREISIPDSVAHVGEDAFLGCNSFDQPVLGHIGIAVKTADNTAGEKVFVLTAEKQWCYRTYADADGNIRETLVSSFDPMSASNNELIWGLLARLQSRSCDGGTHGYIQFDLRDYGGPDKFGRKSITELSAGIEPLPAGDELRHFVYAFFPKEGELEADNGSELDRTVCTEIMARFDGYSEPELDKASIRALLDKDVLTYEGIRLYRELLKNSWRWRKASDEKGGGAESGQEFFPF